MNHAEFEILLKKMHTEELNLNRTKGIEYSQGKSAAHNFYATAQDMGLSPETILWIFLNKHLDSIASFIRTKKVYSEPIEGRIDDARLYLALLRCLIEEGKQNVPA